MAQLTRQQRLQRLSGQVVPINPEQNPADTSPSISQRVIYQNENLSTRRRIIQGFERGQLDTRGGRAKFGTINDTSPELQAQLDGIKARQMKLGDDDGGGFTSFLAGSAKIIGQYAETLSSGKTARNIAFGASVGAGIGLAGGPLAPVTVAAGVIAGAGAGLLTSFAGESFVTNGGDIYVEAIGAGVNKETAKYLAYGGGVLTAALDTVSASLILKPVSAAGKALFTSGVKAVLKRPAVLAAAKQFAKDYSLALGGEVVTETLQEAVQIAAVEIGKKITPKELDMISAEEVATRLENIAIETFKGMALLALPGAVVNFTASSVAASRAKATKKSLVELQAAVEEGKKLGIPEADLVDQQEQLMEEGKVSGVHISVDALDEYAASIEVDPAQVYEDLGVTSQVEEAHTRGNDVVLTNRTYIEKIQNTEAFNSLVDFVRLKPESMTEAEAREFEKTGFQEELDLVDTTRQTTTPEEQAVATAEAQLGLQAMFKSAKEAGMTPKEYEAYLTKLQKAADTSNSRHERAQLKIAQKENKEALKAERVVLEDQATETVRQQPIYGALNSLGAIRLDQAATLAALKGDKKSLQALPRQVGGRRIYAPAGEPGITPSDLADLYGIDGGDILLFQLLDNFVTEADAIRIETDRLVAESPNGLAREQAKIEAAYQALAHDQQSAVLAAELNALRAAIKAKTVRLPLLRAAVRARLGQYLIKDIKPAQFLVISRRQARLAAKLLRKGDREGAAQAKFRQLLNFQYMLEAYKIKDQVKAQRKYLRKFAKKAKVQEPGKVTLPLDYLLAIRTLLGGTQLKARLTDKARNKLLVKFWKKEAERGVAIQMPKRLLEEQEGKTHYENLTLEAWNELYNTVKEVEHKGFEQGKMLRESTKEQLDEITADVADNIIANLKNRSGQIVETRWERNKKVGKAFASIIINADTTLRKADGWKNLGKVYLAIKGGIDQAMTEGYQPGQSGYVRREAQASERIVKLFSVFTKQERGDMTLKVNIPGVRRQMSHQSIIATLLNSGNLENRRALIASGQFTEEELQLVWDHASKRDWEFTQSVWDYLEEFWPEVKQTVKRRKNVDSQKVEALEVNTVHGAYRGGYYPLKYNSDESILASFTTMEELVREERFGAATLSHTQDGHTKDRTQGQEGKVKLDLQVFNSHVNQVIYDLEMGDAVYDSYRVLYSNHVKKAYEETGNISDWEKLDVWLANAVTGEMHATDVMSVGARYLRGGFTVSKIGFNPATIALQPLGLLQSAVILGKRRVIMGLMTVMKSPQWGPNNIYDAVGAMSGAMETRSATYQQDITVAKQLLKSSLVRKFTPGNTAEYMADLAFIGIKKLQRMVDTAVWLAAHEKALEEFNGDEAKAIRQADRDVIRTQASGNFQERTPIEQGARSKKDRQNEMLRAMVPLFSYFAVKTNIMLERSAIAKRDFKQSTGIIPKLGVTISYTTDMMLLYTVEALLAAAIRGQLPDDPSDLVEFAFLETARSIGAGLPIIRDVLSEAVGFRGGGVYGSTLGEFRKFAVQAYQGKIDTALVKSGGRLFGTLFAIPGASYGVKLFEVGQKAASGEDVRLLEWFMGPRWEK